MRGINKQELIIDKLFCDITDLDVKKLREHNFNWTFSSIVCNILIDNKNVSESFFIFADKDTIFAYKASFIVVNIPLILFMRDLDGSKGHIFVMQGYLSKLKLESGCRK